MANPSSNGVAKVNRTPFMQVTPKNINFCSNSVLDFIYPFHPINFLRIGQIFIRPYSPNYNREIMGKVLIKFELSFLIQRTNLFCKIEGQTLLSSAVW